MIVLSFLLFLALFVGVGLYSVKKSKGTNSDYLLAGRSVPPWMVALSAVSTNNSGYMFIGQIGFTYSQGLSSIWIALGWIIGDFLISFLVHQKLRDVAADNAILSFGGLISNWWGENHKFVRKVVGLITLIFLVVYAAAQLKAGGKALTALFGWESSTGIFLGAAMVVAYCFAGGIRASIWTDVTQSFVMLGSMFLLLIYAIMEVGGWSDFWLAVRSVSDTYFSLQPQNQLTGQFWAPALFIMGWIFAGAGIIGQPHIMIRMMTMDGKSKMSSFRTYYYTWFLTFYLLAIGVGMAARVLIPAAENFDPEMALPQLSLQLLPQLLVGVMLAGIFAATMSTADSQILSCSAAVTRDLFIKKNTNYIITKVTTLIITFFSMIIALYAGSNVFYLVLYAWSVLASAFAPILILYCFSVRIEPKTIIAMMLSGMLTAIIWKNLELNFIIYEAAPGVTMGFVVFALSRLFTFKTGNV